MYLFLKFVHLIAAAVYLGLPITFGRWFHNASASRNQKVLGEAIAKIRLFVRFHLSLCGILLAITGTLMANTLPVWPSWAWLGLGFVILTLVNLNLNLGPALARYAGQLSHGIPEQALNRSLRIRIALFSAIHHSMVTAAVAVMVFRTPL